MHFGSTFWMASSVGKVRRTSFFFSFAFCFFFFQIKRYPCQKTVSGNGIVVIFIMHTCINIPGPFFFFFFHQHVPLYQKLFFSFSRSPICLSISIIMKNSQRDLVPFSLFCPFVLFCFPCDIAHKSNTHSMHGCGVLSCLVLNFFFLLHLFKNGWMDGRVDGIQRGVCFFLFL